MKIRNGWCTVDVSRLEKRKQINLRKEFKLLVSKTTRTINIKFFFLILHPGAAFEYHWNNSRVFLEKLITSKTVTILRKGLD